MAVSNAIKTGKSMVVKGTSARGTKTTDNYSLAGAGPAYNATKRAVLALSESINMEECGHGIRATSLLPGEVATPIMEKRPVPPTKETRERMVQPEDMGRAILFLAQMPARACVNELVISPTHNRFYLGGLETPPPAKP